VSRLQRPGRLPSSRELPTPGFLPPVSVCLRIQIPSKKGQGEE
jgi:hypothetical protein